MRVLWLSHFLLYPETGFGALQRSRNLLSSIGSHAEVHLLSQVTPEQAANRDLLSQARADLQRHCRSVEFVTRSGAGILTPRMRKATDLISGWAMRVPYSVMLYRSKEFQHRVAESLSCEAYDLVHADTIGLIEPLLKTLSVPAVLNHHNVESAMMERRAARAGEAGGVRSLSRAVLQCEAKQLADYERRWCAKYRMHLVVSPEDGAELERRVGTSSPVRVIENCVDTDYFLPRVHPPLQLSDSTPARQPELLFVGGMDWYPNRDAIRSFLAQAWPAMQARWPGLRLSVVGRDAGMAAEFASTSGVQFTGFVDDVRPYFARATAFICPMQDGGGTRLKILDTLAAGLPLISTRMGCEGIAVLEGEHVLFASSPEEWVRALEQLTSRPELAVQLTSAGRKLIESVYSKRVVGQRLIAAYQEATLSSLGA